MFEDQYKTLFIACYRTYQYCSALSAHILQGFSSIIVLRQIALW